MKAAVVGKVCARGWQQRRGAGQCVRQKKPLCRVSADEKALEAGAVEMAEGEAVSAARIKQNNIMEGSIIHARQQRPRTNRFHASGCTVMGWRRECATGRECYRPHGAEPINNHPPLSTPL